MPNTEKIDHKPNNEILYLCDRYPGPNMLSIYDSKSQYLKEFEENLKSPKALNTILTDVSAKTDFKFNIKGKGIDIVDRTNLVVAYLEPSNNDYLIKSPLAKSSIESADTAANKLIEIYHLKEKDNERVSKKINAER